MSHSRRLDVLRAHLANSVDKRGDGVCASDVQGFLPNNRPDGQNKISSDFASPYLEGNFAPTPNEGYWESLPVEGVIPRDLKGEFLRIGPNPRFDFKGFSYHPFDGDGFIHGFLFRDGKVSYTKKYVQTKRLQKSIERGFDVAEFGEIAMGNFTYMGYVADENYQRMGKANTNMIFHAGKLLALEEQDKPYAISVSENENENLRTVGQVDFGGKLQHVVTAHPKRDYKTGELVFFGYSVMEPHVHVSVADKQGDLLRTLVIPLPEPVMMHDFVITEHFTILFDMNYQFQMERVREGMSAYVHRKDLPSRFGVLPRHAKDPSEIKWFTISPCATTHFANAWEEENGRIIKIIGARSDTNSFSWIEDKRAGIMIEETKTLPHLYSWTIDLSPGGGVVEERRISDDYVEFPQIDQERTGYKTDIVYGARFLPPSQYKKCQVNVEDAIFYSDAALKYNLRTGEVVRHEYRTKAGNKGFGGEPAFARLSNQAEDAGVIIAVVHDEITNASEVQVLDAAHGLKLIARIPTPERVPYGFHSFFCPSTNFQQR